MPAFLNRKMKIGSLALEITNRKNEMGLGFRQKISWEMGFNKKLGKKGGFTLPPFPLPPPPLSLKMLLLQDALVSGCTHSLTKSKGRSTGVKQGAKE